MPSLRSYSVFVSHAWRYGGDYDRMVDLLNAAPNFVWRNLSVPKAKPLETSTDAELTDELKDQMRTAHVVLILGGIYVSYSKWIQEEIELATSYWTTAKPIVGVRPRGSTNLPDAVNANADTIVGWKTSSVVQAIRDYSL